MVILILLSVSLGLVVKDVVPAARQRNFREAWVHLAFIVTGFAVLTLWAMGIKLPSPLLPMQHLIERMLKG